MHSHPKSTTSGFTLVEMSIVIAVIGLLIGGVLAGREMLKNSNVLSVIADYQRYQQAIAAYKTKYKELPGDHSDATSITSADGTCPSPAASDTLTTATCNGNGDGVVGDMTGSPLGAYSNGYESLLLWQHLTNARMIDGSYNGRRSTGTANITLGINLPKTAVGGATFMFRYFPTSTAGNYFPAEYRHVMFFGAPGAAYDLPNTTGVISAQLAYQIDSKIDNGQPGLGSVMTLNNSNGACATSDDAGSAAYNLTNSLETLCSLIFITGL